MSFDGILITSFEGMLIVSLDGTTGSEFLFTSSVFILTLRIFGAIF